MKKFLLSLSAFIPIFSMSSIVTNSTQIGHFPKENVEYIQENINIISNSDDKSAVNNDFLTYKGLGDRYAYRLYLDSTNDNELPIITGKPTEDKIINKGDRDIWHTFSVETLSLDITTLTPTKTQFLEKYQAMTTSFTYMYNFWNSSKGWTYARGKDALFNIDEYTFNLTEMGEEKTLFIVTDSTHDRNEWVRLDLHQFWEGNLLKIELSLGVKYSWANGSPINHAAITAFSDDMYTLIAVSTDDSRKTIKTDKVQTTAELTTDSSSEIVGVNTVDELLMSKAKTDDIKSAYFKTTTLMIAYFYGTMVRNNTIYHYTITMRWLGDTLTNSSASLLLNGSSFTRTITSIIYEDGWSQKFVTKTSYGSEETSERIFFIKDYMNIKLTTGKLVIPFIYVI